MREQQRYCIFLVEATHHQRVWGRWQGVCFTQTLSWCPTLGQLAVCTPLLGCPVFDSPKSWMGGEAGNIEAVGERPLKRHQGRATCGHLGSSEWEWSTTWAVCWASPQGTAGTVVMEMNMGALLFPHSIYYRLLLNSKYTCTQGLPFLCSFTLHSHTAASPNSAGMVYAPNMVDVW